MKSNTEHEKPNYSLSPHSDSMSNACKKRIHKNYSYNRKHSGTTNILPMRKKSAMHAKVFFDVSPNKCLQKAILSLANHVCANVHEVLLRMLRAT